MHFPVFSLIFPQIFFIFFLILVFRVGGSSTREGPGYANDFFSNFLRFWYQMMSHMFLITHKKFHGLKVFPWKDTTQKVSNMVTIKLIQLSIGDCNLPNCFVHPNGLTDLTTFLNLEPWSTDSQHTNETLTFNNRNRHLLGF